MSRFTCGMEESAASFRVTVVWARTVLEVRKGRSAVMHIPFRGGRSSASGIVSTSRVLTAKGGAADGTTVIRSVTIRGQSPSWKLRLVPSFIRVSARPPRGSSLPKFTALMSLKSDPTILIWQSAKEGLNMMIEQARFPVLDVHHGSV
ncbi:hypothetical protein NDU88_006956 [Pleurodeles waltl]|uniref:Uncharacterized protein n=1 Tax=Pleurodeles waltl TaxID=8319 RepID=A0AAV7PL48_PLEWA|nr:hypothetical protein NDU88_006956 [Pleurodeles waltl]